MRAIRWLIVLSALWHPASAQQLRGTVRDSALLLPIAGAVISIIDSAGSPGSRTISDASGRFAVSLSARSARVRVIRIGYQPRDLRLPAGPNPTLDVSMVRLPAVLDAVRVSGDQLCPGSVDRGPAFQLWEQARAGLLASVVAREANPAMATSLVFKRQVAPGDGLVLHQETKTNSGRTTRAFLAAAPASEFAATGYMREDPSGRTFFAPDADVLLDESFATSHCFQLQAADAAHTDQIGLAFTPARNRDAVVDVRGVIWMDRATPALRSLDFRYTELEPANTNAGAGGHMEFRDVANGVSFIERWVLRLPTIVPIPPSASATVRVPRRRQERTEYRVTSIDETGGIVLAAKWPDGTSWQMPLSGVSGTVVQRSNSGASPFAIVTLSGTADTVTANAHGEFSLVPTLPGRYLITAADTTLAAFAASRGVNRTIDVPRDGVASVRLEVTTLVAVLEEVCAGQRGRPKPRPLTTTILGRVFLPDTLLARGATVRGTWQADYNAGGAVTTGGEITVTTSEQTSSVDAQGRFVVCGVAVMRPVHLRVSSPGLSADTTIKPAEGLFTSVDWRPQIKVLVATGTLTGVVNAASSNAPLSGAEVSLMPTGRSVLTSDDGVFQFSQVPAGSYEVRVRRVGHIPLTDSIVVDGGGRVRRVYILSPAVVLDTVRTKAAERTFISPALRGFEERRRGGFGSFISDSILRLRENSRLSDLLRMVPGVTIRPGRGSVAYAISSRDTRSGRTVFSGGSGNTGCFSTIYIDGILLFEHPPSPQNPARDLNDFSLSTLGGVEFYPSPATTPPQFKSSPCGTLLLWTRER